MRMHTRTMLTGLVAALALAAAVGAAGARRFEISSQPIRMSWTNTLLLTSNPEVPPEISVTCEVTLEGSFHSRTISKVSGALIGYITRVAVGNCPGGGTSTMVNGTLPWHVIYNSFRGTLPNITAVRIKILDMGFLFTTPEVACQYTSTVAKGAFAGFLELAAGTVSGFRADEMEFIEEEIRLPEKSIRLFCPSRIFPRGTARFTVLNSTTAVTIRLVQ